MTLPGLAQPLGGSSFAPLLYIRSNQQDFVLFDALGQPSYPVDATVYIDDGVQVTSSAGGSYPVSVHVPGPDAFTIDQFDPDSTFLIYIGTAAGVYGAGGDGGQGGTQGFLVYGGGGGGAGIVAGPGGDAVAPATSFPGNAVNGGAAGADGVSGSDEGIRINFPGGNGTHAFVTGDYEVTIENSGVIQGGGGGGYGGASGIAAVAGGGRGADAPDFAGSPLTGYGGNAVLGSNTTINGGSVFGDNDNTPRFP